MKKSHINIKKKAVKNALRAVSRLNLKKKLNCRQQLFIRQVYVFVFDSLHIIVIRKFGVAGFFTDI